MKRLLPVLAAGLILAGLADTSPPDPPPAGPAGLADAPDAAPAETADAYQGHDHRLHQVPGQPRGTTFAPLAITPAEADRRAAPYGGVGPAAFVAILNVERGRFGLPPVTLDQSFRGEARSPHYVSSSNHNIIIALDNWLYSPHHRAAVFRHDLACVAVDSGPWGSAATARVRDAAGRLVYPDGDGPRTAEYVRAMEPVAAASPDGRGY